MNISRHMVQADGTITKTISLVTVMSDTNHLMCKVNNGIVVAELQCMRSKQYF